MVARLTGVGRRLGVAAMAVCATGFAVGQGAAVQPVLGAGSGPVVTVDGLQFRDLNRDGKLEPFEDWRLPAPVRARDLVGRMSLEEKAGLMMHGSAKAMADPAGEEGGKVAASIGRGSAYDLDDARDLIGRKHVTTLITRLTAAPGQMAAENNKLQVIAAEGRWGIPLTISTDPRNAFTSVTGASNDAVGFSRWPDMTGMGALGDVRTTRQFGDMARQEYRAVGIQEALSPQADLATEPRWSRIDGTFGDVPQRVKAQVEAYVAGFQGGETGLTADSVMCIVKHFAGYGAMKDGLDSHNSYSRHAVQTDASFAQHLVPFEGAFAAKVAGVMPTYAIVDGVTVDGKPMEAVGAGFNRQLLTGVLRGQMGFSGIVLTDWLITSDCVGECLDGAPAGKSPGIVAGKFGMPWGVEGLTPQERYAKAIAAGVDQFGGVSDADLIVALVKSGKVTQARVDASAERLLRQKFELGLFENPYVDASIAGGVVGNPTFRRAALAAQERSMVLLTNKDAVLPVRSRRVYLVGIDPLLARAAGLISVKTPGEADFAVVRMSAPHQMLHPGYFFGSRQHEGDLDWKADDAELKAFEEAAEKTPTIAAVYLDRPAILTQVAAKAAAVLVNFGSSDEALLQVVTGRVGPEGTLPFELPRSMDAVRAQQAGVPDDSRDPLFTVGSGLRYAAAARRTDEPAPPVTDGGRNGYTPR